ncbi:MAG: NAD(+)/NADH kinase, partial [Alkalimonas sp.]|nr:NAD(+)/NADH kinase [Alkalimonas sp.]
MFRLGFIVNPLAGLGGSVGLKGSDGVAEQALALGAEPLANQRSETALQPLLPLKDKLVIKTVAGSMGQQLVAALGFVHQICYQPRSEPTTAEDTEAAAKALVESGIDLLLFAGGDGTARNICAVLPEQVTALGIPAGCKIHSGVYAISPMAAG